MPLIATHELTPGNIPFQHQVYNALDCCVTHEVQGELLRLRNALPLVYSFERALQAPCLEMMQRGFRIDGYERDKAAAGIRECRAQLWSMLQEFAAAVWDKTFKNPKTKEIHSLNPRSQKQLIAFFCGAMRLPERWTSKKGVRKLSMDREALEYYEAYVHARPIIACILGIRELDKMLDVLETEIDQDSRFRTSINIAGTETGRFSTSTSAFGTGSNLQNVRRDDDLFTEEYKDYATLPPYVVSLRKMFIADKGKKLGGVDLEQAESREVGWQCGVLFNDWTYLDACEAGDLHTLTCRLIWPGLPWTGDIKKDKKIAEQVFYRHYTYRDMSKRGGHGSNYYGTPFTMARHLKVPTRLMEEFQEKYFSTFPAIPKWHRYVATQLQTTQQLVTPFGRVRDFFGRPRDDTTLRKAIAFVPQSSTADRMNLGLYRVWKHMGGRVGLLAQVHDAIYWQFDDGDNEHEIRKEVLTHLNVELTDPKSGRKFTVPGEYKSGWNWGLYHEKFNPCGMRKLGDGDSRKRLEGMERVL